MIPPLHISSFSFLALPNLVFMWDQWISNKIKKRECVFTKSDPLNKNLFSSSVNSPIFWSSSLKLSNLESQSSGSVSGWVKNFSNNSSTASSFPNSSVLASCKNRLAVWNFSSFTIFFLFLCPLGRLIFNFLLWKYDSKHA